MRKKKTIDVPKFGGVDDLGAVRMHGYQHEVSSVEDQSKTKLEFDEGHGEAAIIRCFTFGANPEAFNEHPPTTQELFNSHLKGIEIALWRDGLKVLDEVQPRVLFDKKKTTYQIFVGARPMKGHILREKPQTLRQIVHAERFGNE